MPLIIVDFVGSWFNVWELTRWEVDLLGVDFMKVDLVGLTQSRKPHLSLWRVWLGRLYGSKTCPPLRANGFYNALKLSPPCRYFSRCRWTFAGKCCICLSSKEPERWQHIFEILNASSSEFCPLQIATAKQWQTLVPSRRQLSFVRDHLEGGGGAMLTAIGCHFTCSVLINVL